jgi:AcrR family transcriptional regulator
MSKSTEPSSATPRRGRPRDPARLQRIVAAARRQFHAHGFGGTSLDAVAAESGVAKMTIYSYFASKEALFAAVIAARTDTAFGADKLELSDPAQPEKVLRQVGAEFLRLMRADEVIGQFRTLYAASAQQPQACAAFYRQAPGRLVAELAGYLRRARACGSLQVEHPEVAADQFLALFLGSATIKSMLGLGKPSAAADGQLLRHNVAMFMRAYGR